MTEDAVVDRIWQGDLLQRRADAKLLQAFLVGRHAERRATSQEGAYVLNLNAPWGYGKTFFARRFAEQLKADGHPVCYVNAWEDDAAKEPLVAVMAAIEDAVRPHFRVRKAAERIWNAAKKSGGEALLAVAKGAAKRVIKKVVGEGVEEVIEIYHDAEFEIPYANEAAGLHAKEESEASLASDVAESVGSIADRLMADRLGSFRKRIESVQNFKNSMRKLLANISLSDNTKLPMFVLVDELDRCRPTYAIEMIEQVKHLFDVEDIIFIISSDTDQLSRAIGAVYGDRFDGSKYLRRFFNRQYAFPEPDMAPFCEFMFKTHFEGENTFSTPLDVSPYKYFSDAMVAYELTLRDAQQIFDILRNFVTTWDYKIQIEMAYLVPLIIYYHSGDLIAFDEAAMGGGNLAQGPRKPWSYTYKVNERDFRVSERKIDGFKIFNEFKKLNSKSLYDMKYDSDDTIINWIFSRYYYEFSKLHNNRYTRAEPMPSVLCDYGKRIKNLARLTGGGTMN